MADEREAIAVLEEYAGLTRGVAGENLKLAYAIRGSGSHQLYEVANEIALQNVMDAKAIEALADEIAGSIPGEGHVNAHRELVWSGLA